MSTLDDHIGRVERYGFVRSRFPMEFKGHHLQILSNDAHIHEDGRLMFAFCLHCDNCGMMDRLSGRFPDDCDRQVAYVVNAKIAVFSKFEARECSSR